VTGSIDGRFTLGERRRLEVTLDPTTHQIGLSWAR
jgi:hypothetical protein